MTQQLRRLSDKVLSAFHQACDQKEVDIAELLMRALETILTRQGGKSVQDLREDLGPVSEAYNRLDALRKAATPSENP